MIFILARYTPLCLFNSAETCARPDVQLHGGAGYYERQTVGHEELINQTGSCFTVKRYKKWRGGANGDERCQHVFTILDESSLEGGKKSYCNMELSVIQADVDE